MHRDMEFIRTIGKKLFSLATKNDLRVIQAKRKEISVIAHFQCKFISIGNVTWLEIEQNKNSVNNLITTTHELRNWRLWIDRDVHSNFRLFTFYQQMHESLILLNEQVQVL